MLNVYSRSLLSERVAEKLLVPSLVIGISVFLLREPSRLKGPQTGNLQPAKVNMCSILETIHLKLVRVTPTWLVSVNRPVAEVGVGKLVEFYGDGDQRPFRGDPLLFWCVFFLCGMLLGLNLGVAQN